MKAQLRRVSFGCRPIGDGAQSRFPALVRPFRGPPSSPKCTRPAKAPRSTLIFSPVKSSQWDHLAVRSQRVMHYDNRRCVRHKTTMPALRSGTPSLSPRHSPRWAQKAGFRAGKWHRRAQLDTRADLGTISTRGYRGGSVVMPGPARSVLLALGRE